MAKTNYKNELSKLFASFAVVAFGSLAIINTFLLSGTNPGVSSFVFALKITIPSAIVMGFIGYIIGTVLDRKPQKRRPTLLATQNKKAASANKIESVFVDEQKPNELPIGDANA